MVYGDLKYLARRTTSEKILRDKVFIIAKNPNKMNIKEVLLQGFINFLIKKLLVKQLKIRTFQAKSQLKNYTK